MNSTTTKRSDITIVGGGIAGLALGIGLRRRDVAVCVHEAETYPRHRVCGEFINGVTRGTLGALGIAELLDDALTHRMTRWFHNGRQIYRARLPEAALALSRFVLDDRLQKRFREVGGNLVTGSRLKPDPEAGRVWAAGRSVGGKGQWIGLKCHVEDLEVSGDLEMHLGSGAYVGMTPVENGRVNVCGLFPSGRIAEGATRCGLLIAALRAHRMVALADRIAEAHCLDESFVGAGGFTLGVQPPHSGLCALGDAEAIIPPFTGNGMSMALEAAESALDPLTDFSCGKSSWSSACQSVSRSLEKRFRTRLRVAHGLHSMLLRPQGQFMLSAISQTRLLPFRLVHSLLT